MYRIVSASWTVVICSHKLCFSQICSSSNFVPKCPHWQEVKDETLPPRRVLSKEDVAQLESISLVQYKNTLVEKSRLEDMIRLADSLQVVNTDNIEPMYYVHENSNLYLRQDVAADKTCAKDILKNAKIVEEDYFVAPPGNVSFYESYFSNNDHVNLEQTNS